MTDHQCPSCGGFCTKSGCERENVKPEQPSCQTCAHHIQRGSIESFDSTCFECQHYYGSKWEVKT